MGQGGQVVKYTAMLACGNYHGVVGFAKAKGPGIPIALQKVLRIIWKPNSNAHQNIEVHW